MLGEHPRTLIQIVLQARGGPTIASQAKTTVGYLNAASAALLEAGSVPMRGVLSAVVVASKGGRPVADSEASDADSTAALGYIFPSGDLVWSDWDGVLNRDEMVGIINAGRERASSVYQSALSAVAGRAAGQTT